MFERAIDTKTKNALELLNKLSVIEKFYLAGGTALSLQLGHRKSYDLDFFSQEEFDTEIIAKKLKSSGDFIIDMMNNKTLTGIFNKIKVSFFYYPYKVIFPFEKYNSIKIASVADIGVMKMVAITNRGAKRDFIDLYFILKGYFSLETMLKLYKEKYGEFAMNEINIKKGLVFFADADAEKMPKMFKEVRWRDVKNFFEKTVIS